MARVCPSAAQVRFDVRRKVLDLSLEPPRPWYSDTLSSSRRHRKGPHSHSPRGTLSGETATALNISHVLSAGIALCPKPHAASSWHPSESARFRELSRGCAMTGRVVEINAAGRMIGVQTEAGDCSVIEILLADQVEIGDTIEWSGRTPLGRIWATNVSKGARFTAFFQSHGVKGDDLRHELLLGPWPAA